MTAQTSLYGRLGDTPANTAVVDGFIGAVASDAGTAEARTLNRSSHFTESSTSVVNAASVMFMPFDGTLAHALADVRGGPTSRLAGSLHQHGGQAGDVGIGDAL